MGAVLVVSGKSSAGNCLKNLGLVYCCLGFVFSNDCSQTKQVTSDKSTFVFGHK